ncbi:MAG: ATP-binding protein, partial [Acidimicrobiaceae bacterium]|nr:ATP-binding protein [Acidimicrobiaceae bacterium]
MRIIARHMQPRLEEALDNFRVVMLHGARQCGKSTLARLVAAQRGGTYTSLDNEATRQAAAADPR